MERLGLALLGWAIYIVIFDLSPAKDQTDGTRAKWRLSKWWASRWDNLLGSFLLMIAVAWKGPELWDWFADEYDLKMEFSDAMYMGTGVLYSVIHKLIRKFTI